MGVPRCLSCEPGTYNPTKGEHEDSFLAILELAVRDASHYHVCCYEIRTRVQDVLASVDQIGEKFDVPGTREGHPCLFLWMDPANVKSQRTA